jgi:hypothetical protein
MKSRWLLGEKINMMAFLFLVNSRPSPSGVEKATVLFYWVKHRLKDPTLSSNGNLFWKLVRRAQAL